MIKIDKQTNQKLVRLQELNEMCPHCLEVSGYSDEYKKLKLKLTGEFAPLVQRLASAGLISAWVADPEGDGITEIYDVLHVQFHDADDEDTNNICLFGQVNGAIPIEELEDD